MSACAGLGIDNLYVDITAERCPSSTARLVRSCSCCRAPASQLQDAPKRFIRVPEAGRGARRRGRQREVGAAGPYDGFKLDFEIEFNHPAVDAHRPARELDLGDGHVQAATSRARAPSASRRTWRSCAAGPGARRQLDNAIVVDDYRMLNADGLRYDDEFVKHKILDAIGDLYLVGQPLLASYTAFKSGHALNNQLLRALLAHPEPTRSSASTSRWAPACARGADGKGEWALT